jgi:hypothetical protein
MLNTLVIVALLGTFSSAATGSDPAEDAAVEPAAPVTPADGAPAPTPTPAPPGSGPQAPATVDEEADENESQPPSSVAPTTPAPTTPAPTTPAPETPAIPDPATSPADHADANDGVKDDDSGDAERQRAAAAAADVLDQVDAGPMVPNLPDADPAPPTFVESPVFVGLATAAAGCVGAGATFVAGTRYPYVGLLAPVSAVACSAATAGGMDFISETGGHALIAGAVATGGVLAGGAVGAAAGSAPFLAFCLAGADCAFPVVVGALIGGFTGIIILGPILGGVAVGLWKGIDTEPTATAATPTLPPKAKTAPAPPGPSADAGAGF